MILNDLHIPLDNNVKLISYTLYALVLKRLDHITNKLKVTTHTKLTSRAPVQAKEKKYSQVKFDNLEVVVMEKNMALYGDAFNEK